MTSKAYIRAVILAICGAALLFVAVNVIIDSFGLFSSTKGRSLKIYYVERTAKFLFAQHYIPERFDGMIIGSSLSVNIPVRAMTAQRLYNASINGGNISEVSLVANEAFARKKFTTIIFCLNPYLIKDHGKKTSYQDPREYLEALGSPQLLKHYLSMILIKAGIRPDYFDEYGTCRFTLDVLSQSATELIDERVGELRKRPPQTLPGIDSVAWEELAQLVRNAQMNAGCVVAYFPPVPQRILALAGADFDRFRQRMSSLFRPADQLVDFNDLAYEAFRLNDANYRDSAHLSERGAEVIAGELDRRLQLLVQRR